jgi:hypothetical protein
MPEVTMSMEEYLALVQGVEMMSRRDQAVEQARAERAVEQSKKRRNTKYQRTYKKAFRNVQSKYQKKDGTWKKNGFRSAVREAHRIAKRAVK